MAQYYLNYILHMRHYNNGIVLSTIYSTHVALYQWHITIQDISYTCGIISMAQYYPRYILHMQHYINGIVLSKISPYTYGIISMAQYYPRYILHMRHYNNGIVLSTIYPTHLALYQQHSTIQDISYTCGIISMAKFKKYNGVKRFSKSRFGHFN